MILFQLKCDHDHEFEGWFKDSATYEAQSSGGELSCPLCGSVHVGKALMAPRLRTGRQKEQAEQTQKQAALAMATQTVLAEMRAHVEKNCEHVGDKFAEEARKIHYGEADMRGIYGQATPDEAVELIEEGIDVHALPWLENHKKN